MDSSWQRVHGFLCGMVGETDAEDLTLHAYAIALEKLDTLRDRDRAPSWVLSIAANAARRHLRRERHRHASLSDALVPRTSNSDHSRAERLRVHEALDSLSASDREVLLLVGLLGYTPPEAADILSVSTAAAYKRWERARDRFQAEYLGETP